MTHTIVLTNQSLVQNQGFHVHLDLCLPMMMEADLLVSQSL